MAGNTPKGFVKIEEYTTKEGKRERRVGSRVDIITANGERALKEIDGSVTCPWIEKLREPRRYFPPQETRKEPELPGLLEILRGNLRVYGLLEKGTFQRACQLQDARQKNHKLQGKGFYTSDGNGFFPNADGGVDWIITPEENNPVLTHLEDKIDSSYDQLNRTGFFLPDNAEAQRIRYAQGVSVVNMSNLRLLNINQRYSLLAIRTEDGFVKTKNGFETPTWDERRVMEAFGFSLENMSMMYGSAQKIKTARIYTLDPSYVVFYVIKEIRKNHQHGSLWTASWIGGFGSDSYLHANYHNVKNSSCLLGTRSK